MAAYQSPGSLSAASTARGATPGGGYLSDYSSDFYNNPMDPAESECLEHYENNLEKYKGSVQNPDAPSAIFFAGIRNAYEKAQRGFVQCQARLDPPSHFSPHFVLFGLPKIKARAKRLLFKACPSRCLRR
uniref:Occludin_ELL domain-containing protein n=1 Tax=Panagrellus redivivus TaxID=6233 RepID=A0A7E4VA70_PANRE